MTQLLDSERLKESSKNLNTGIIVIVIFVLHQSGEWDNGVSYFLDTHSNVWLQIQSGLRNCCQYKNAFAIWHLLLWLKKILSFLAEMPSSWSCHFMSDWILYAIDILPTLQILYYGMINNGVSVYNDPHYVCYWSTKKKSFEYLFYSLYPRTMWSTGWMERISQTNMIEKLLQHCRITCFDQTTPILGVTYLRGEWFCFLSKQNVPSMDFMFQRWLVVTVSMLAEKL